MMDDATFADGLDALLTRMTSPGNRRCYNRSRFYEGDDMLELYCDRAWGHPLPHSYGDRTWPQREEILARQ